MGTSKVSLWAAEEDSAFLLGHNEMGFVFRLKKGVFFKNQGQ